MSEFQAREAVMQFRGEQLAAGLSKALGNGLSAELARGVDFKDKTQMPDIFKVYLGLKPASVFLNEGLTALSLPPGRGFLSQMSTDGVIGVNVRHDIGVGGLWNPQMASEVLSRESELLMGVLQDQPDLMRYSPNPNHPDFVNFLVHMSIAESSAKARLLAGLLHGFPRPAAEMFSEHYPDLIKARDEVWLEALNAGVEIKTRPAISLNEMADMADKRDEMVRLMDILDYGSIEFRDLVSNLRLSRTAGNRYLTLEGLTQKEEEEEMSLYQASGIEQAYRALLDAQKPLFPRRGDDQVVMVII